MRVARLVLAVLLAVSGVCAAGSGNGAGAVPYAGGAPSSASSGIAAPESSGIRREVAVACGLTDVRAQSARRRAAAGIGDGLSPAEVGVMLGFLDEKLDAQREYEPLAFNAIKNDVSSALIRQRESTGAYLSALAGMYRDPGHDYVWRDYCIQHMARCCAELLDRNGGIRTAEARSVFACLEDAAGQVRLPLSGTALIGLAAVAGKKGGPELSGVCDAAFRVARDRDACCEARATALQVAAEKGDRRVLDMARELAESGSDALLRVSAVAAVGRVGEASDRAVLERLSLCGDPRVSAAAVAASRKLASRPADRPMFKK